jgi:uncharacterized repeat protein (TIGR01451 family)
VYFIHRTNRRPLLAILLLTILPSLSSAWAAVNTWTSLGPDGAIVSQLVFHNTSANIVYAVAESGFFRSTDGGSHWQQNQDGVAPFAVSISVDPSNSDRIYLTARLPNNRLFVSNDAGATFATLDASPAGGLVGVSADGNTLYLVSAGQVFRSSDKGQNWQLQPALQLPATGANIKVEVDPLDDGTAYLANSKALFVTHDGGSSWTDITPPAEKYSLFDFTVNPSNTRTLWTAGYGGVNLSTDGGASWVTAYNVGTTALTLDPRSPSTAYAAYAGGQLLKTTDNGGTWSVAGNPGWLQPSVLTVSPRDGSRIFMGALNGLSVTNDGGANWSSSDSGLVGSYVSALVHSSARGRFYLSGAEPGTLVDGGNYVTALAETTPYPYSAGWPFLLVPTSDAPGGLLVSTVNRIGRSTDDGVTWSPTGYLIDLTDQILTLTATTTLPSVYYASSTRTLQRSTDQGATWDSIANGFPSGYSGGVMAIAPGNSAILYAGPRTISAMEGGPRGAGLYRSSDGGDNWLPANIGIEQSLVESIAVDPIDPDIVYAQLMYAGLMKTTNGGASWKAVSWSPDHAIATGIGFDPKQPNIMYVVGTGIDRNAQVARSLDGGTTWQSLISPLTAREWSPTSVAIDPSQPDTVLVGTRFNGVQRLTFQLTDLAVEEGQKPSGLFVGDAASYTFTVRNLGPVRASGVNMVIQLPSGSTGATATISGRSCSVASSVITCTVASLEAGASAMVSASLTPAKVPGTFELDSNVYGDQPDSDSSNNSTARTTAVSQQVIPPPSSSSVGNTGGGGGGADSPLFLMGLVTFLFWRQRQRLLRE